VKFKHRLAFDVVSHLLLDKLTGPSSYSSLICVFFSINFSHLKKQIQAYSFHFSLAPPHAPPVLATSHHCRKSNNLLHNLYTLYLSTLTMIAS